MRLRKTSAVLTACTVCLLAGTAWGGSYEQAPPKFPFSDGAAVPIDMASVHVDYVFNPTTRTTVGIATVHFQSQELGYPFFDLLPGVSQLSLDGESLAPSLLATTRDPDAVTTLRVLKRQVEPGVDHEMTMTFALPSSRVTYQNGTVSAGFFTDDLSNTGRGFFEQYGPANYEFDQLKFTFSVRVEGTSEAHEVFTNGALVETGANQWSIDFPDYFNGSALYFHITKKGRFVRQDFVYDGIERSFPVTIYSDSRSRTSQGVDKTKAVLAELEGTYGAFAHDRLVEYLTGDGDGGMEYCGATMTSLWALDHELTHSWFARGVMPSNGNSGWIDESIASWRDDGYQRARGEPSRAAVNLGGFSPYRRQTTDAAYEEGETLMREFDYIGRDNGGLKPILRDLFLNYQRTTITVGFFKAFMDSKLGRDLTQIFNRYVYGRTSGLAKAPVIGPTIWQKPTWRHPRPYTMDELAKYR